LGDGLVRENPDPDPATALDVARDRPASRFDLAGGQAATVSGFEAEIPKCHGTAAGRKAGIAAFLLLAVLSASWLQHVNSP
jgi:hypothetical protein